MIKQFITSSWIKRLLNILLRDNARFLSYLLLVKILVDLQISLCILGKPRALVNLLFCDRILWYISSELSLCSFSLSKHYCKQLSLLNIGSSLVLRNLVLSEIICLIKFFIIQTIDKNYSITSWSRLFSIFILFLSFAYCLTSTSSKIKLITQIASLALCTDVKFSFKHLFCSNWSYCASLDAKISFCFVETAILWFNSEVKIVYSSLLIVLYDILVIIELRFIHLFYWFISCEISNHQMFVNFDHFTLMMKL